MNQSFKMALKSISGNRMRAFLTMLGIIIGVVTLVVLVSLISGATNSVTDIVSDLGSDMIEVNIFDDKGEPVKMSTLEEWEKDPAIGELSPYINETATIKFGTESGMLSLSGTTPGYFEVEGMSMYLGRFLKTTDVDNSNFVCVVNESTATDLIGYVDCVGEEVSINGMKFTIVGVISEDSGSLNSLFMSGTYTAFIPYTTMLKLSSSANTDITEFYVGAAAGTSYAETETAITNYLLERFDDDEDAFEVYNWDTMEDTLGSITNILSIVLGGIAAVSLLVGGIGIMNIMLVTVTERTREIGIRKAVGATRGMILRQFLMEAVVLCMIGCAIGIFLSWVIIQIVSLIASGIGMAFSMNGWVILVGVVFCFAIGVVFGLYPANRAAKMKPIDALHYNG